MSSRSRSSRRGISYRSAQSPQAWGAHNLVCAFLRSTCLGKPPRASSQPGGKGGTPAQVFPEGPSTLQAPRSTHRSVGAAEDKQRVSGGLGKTRMRQSGQVRKTEVPWATLAGGTPLGRQGLLQRGRPPARKAAQEVSPLAPETPALLTLTSSGRDPPGSRQNRSR